MIGAAMQSAWRSQKDLFAMIQTITGAPNRAVTALIGSVACVPGSCEIKSQSNRVMAPQSIAPGSITRWLGVRNNPRAMCGMVIPIKAMGPVNAVDVPASKAVARIESNRKRETEMPNPLA